MITNQYSYNGDGQRVQVIDSQGTKKQVWDGENVLAETDGAGSTQAVYTLEPAGYGNLVSQRRSSTTSTYLFDALGSTRKLTNSASAVTDSYDYRAYGETFASSGSTTNVFRWVGMLGYYFDVDRSAYYVRARHYSPKQARWISQDPIGFRGSKWNLYEYVSARPTDGLDTSGLFAAHGEFCGPTRQARCKDTPSGTIPDPTNPDPIDDLDAACEIHDCCLATWADCTRLWGCNCRLCKAASRMDCWTSPNVASCFAMRTSILTLCSSPALCPYGFIYAIPDLDDL